MGDGATKDALYDGFAEIAKALANGRRAEIVDVLAQGERHVEELATEILRSLPEPDVQRLTEELADLRGVDSEITSEVIEEFWQLLETQEFMVHGGVDYASRLLVEAFGTERAEDLMLMVRRSQEAAQGNLAKLQRTDPQQLGKLLDSEHPQTIALVLAHLDPRRASQVLDNLGEEHKVVAVERLAEMRQFSPEMAQKVAQILHRRLESVGDSARKSYSGFKAVADLMNRLNAEESKRILEKIEESQPELALGIRNLMFTFEDLGRLDGGAIQALINKVEKKELALALKGANDMLKDIFFSNMSARSGKLLRDDMEAMGPVRLKDVDEAQGRLVAMAKDMAARGEIILNKGKSDEEMIG